MLPSFYADAQRWTAQNRKYDWRRSTRHRLLRRFVHKRALALKRCKRDAVVAERGSENHPINPRPEAE